PGDVPPFSCRPTGKRMSVSSRVTVTAPSSPPYRRPRFGRRFARVGPTTPTHFPNADPEPQESHDRVATSDHNTPSLVGSSCDRQITSRRRRPRLHAVRRRAAKEERQLARNLYLTRP